MIVPHARHWSAPERRSTRTVCHVSEIVECRSPRFLTSLVKSSPNASREAWTPSVFSDLAASSLACSASRRWSFKMDLYRSRRKGCRQQWS
jgi:hypothetical protein